MGCVNRRSENRPVRPLRSGRHSSRAQCFSSRSRYVPPLVRVVRIQPRFVYQDLEPIRHGYLLRAVERYRKNRSHNYLSRLYSSSNDSIRKTNPVGSLECNRCLQRVIRWVCSHNRRLLGGGAVGGDHLWVRGGHSFDQL